MRNKSVGVGVANINSIVKDVTKFIILVIKMNEKRFRLIRIDDYVFQIKDIDNDLYLVAEQICNLLNEQQDTIENLRKRVKELEIENEALQDSNDALAEDMFHRLEEVI